MKQFNIIAALLCSLMLFSSGAYAGDFKEKKSWVKQYFPTFFQKQKKKKKYGVITKKQFKKRINRKYKKNYVAPTAVPEIDAAGAAIALALTAGVVSIARERRRKSA